MAADQESADGPATGAEQVQREKWSLRKKFLTLGGVFVTALVGAVATGFGGQIVASLDPYDVETEANRDAIDSKDGLLGGEYIVPQPIQDVPPPPLQIDACSGRHQWARSLGGMDVEATLARITISSSPGNQVQVVGVERVPMGDRRNPATGTLLACPGRGAVVPVRHLNLNLDTNGDEFYDGVSAEPVPLNLSVPGGTTETIDLLATTQQYDWMYEVKLKLRVNGDDTEVTIDDNGEPFRTSARFNAKRYRWIDQQWVDIDQAVGSPSTQPAPSPPSRDPCELVTNPEAAGALGIPLQTSTFGGVSPGASGQPVGAFQCLHTSVETGDLIGVALIEAASTQSARAEFDAQLRLKDRADSAQRLTGVGDVARLVNGSELLILKRDYVLSIYVSREGGVTRAEDASAADRLGRLAATRL